MYRIDSVPAANMYLQPNPDSEVQTKTEVAAGNDSGNAFLKCLKSRLEEANASSTTGITQSQVAGIQNWQYLLVALPLRSKTKIAVDEI